MNITQSRQGFRRVTSALRPLQLLMFAALAAACSTYQAPVVDEGTTVERRRPEVVSSRGTSTAPTQAPPPTTTARTTGAATIAVPPAATGISRTRLGRQPLSREPVASAPATPAQSTSAPPLSAPSMPATGPGVTGAASTAANSREAVPESQIRMPADQVVQRPPTPATHTVARGETLYSIAFQYDLDVRRLALANNLAPPYTIYPNQTLTLNQGGISENAASAVPAIPASPAGESASPQGERPQEAAESRRRESVATRSVDGVNWQWPIQGRVTRSFGNSSGTGRGIDITGQRGEPVYAAADGDVVYSGRGIQGAGDLIIIRHGSRLLSAYMHNSTLLVSEGARVNAGDKIAEVGTDATGQALLHFEIRLDGKPVDPVGYLPAQ